MKSLSITKDFELPVTRDSLTAQTWYARSSRDAYLQRMSAKQIVVSEGRGSVKASDSLFE
ncbi:MAG: hypothetical protein JSS75_07350 [Bacteroidetes bacterium]|nr:hypothetical protein [Bacteroidota bacterium]